MFIHYLVLIINLISVTFSVTLKLVYTSFKMNYIPNCKYNEIQI